METVPTRIVPGTSFTCLERAQARVQHQDAYKAWIVQRTSLPKQEGWQLHDYDAWDDETGFALFEGQLLAFCNNVTYDTDVWRWDRGSWVLVQGDASVSDDDPDGTTVRENPGVVHYRLPAVL